MNNPLQSYNDLYEEENMNESLRVAATQFNHKPGDIKYNLNVMEKMCIEAASKGVQIIVFPEMCVTGYWHIRKLNESQIMDLSEDAIIGNTAFRLKELSVKYNLIIGAGIIEKGDDGQLYNTYIVTQPDRATQYHRKIHCFISEHMSSGDSFTIIDTSLGVKIGILICWDNNLIENVRSTALLGADILLSPHQTGGCKSSSNNFLGKIDIELWENREKDPDALRHEFQSIKGRKWLDRWLPSRAHDNGLFLIFSNGVGLDDDEVRTGNAMLIDCFGEVINESTEISDDIVIGEFNIGLLEHAIGRNWMKGRRPELYSEITKSSVHLESIRELKANE